jgi:hypothetical protein
MKFKSLLPKIRVTQVEERGRGSRVVFRGNKVRRGVYIFGNPIWDVGRDLLGFGLLGRRPWFDDMCNGHYPLNFSDITCSKIFHQKFTPTQQIFFPKRYNSANKNNKNGFKICGPRFSFIPRQLTL